MTILQAITSYSGRMSRSQYWRQGVLPLFVAMLPVFAVLTIAYGPPIFVTGWSLAVSIGLVWFQFPLYVKRLHDRNRSAWFLLISLIPLLGGLWLIIEVGFRRGTHGTNRFGNDPVQKDDALLVHSSGPALNGWPTVALVLNLLLIILFTLIAVKIVPSYVEFFKDRLGDRTLPGITQITVNTAYTYTRTILGTYYGSALLGLWLWLGLRTYSRAGSVNCRRILGASVAIGLFLNVFAAASLYLPKVGLKDRVLSQQYPMNEWMHIKTGVGHEYVAYSFSDERSRPIARGTEAREPLDRVHVSRAINAPDQIIALDGWGNSLTYRVLDTAERQALGLPQEPTWHHTNRK